jgi:hypothetical protein
MLSSLDRGCEGAGDKQVLQSSTELPQAVKFGRTEIGKDMRV